MMKIKEGTASAKILILSALLVGLATGASAQGQIDLDNIYNSSSSSSSLTNGLFWVKTNGAAPALIHQDFNAAFYAGANATNLTSIATFLTSDGSATGDNLVGPGFFLDPSGASRVVSGASSSAFFQIQAWFGNYSSYSAAVAAGAYAAQSPVFSNSVAGPPSPPPDLTGMPAIVLTAGGSGSSPPGFTGGGSSGGGSSSGGTPPSSPSGPLGASSIPPCGLWLSVTTSNTTATLTLHNTRQGESYLVWSAQIVNQPFTNWGLEKSLLGAAGDTTQTNIAMGTRSNLFFRAQEHRDYATNTVFQGLSYADTLGPVADTMGAVGPNHFIELLNGKITLYNKSGTNIAQTNMIGFFSVHDPDGTNYPTGSPMSDPRILFDPASQRWVATALDPFGSGQAILAVSNGDSPTNLDTGWKRYLIRVHSASGDSDFDTLGLDANGLYLSVLHRASSTNAGHTVVAIKKPDIYLGTNISTYLNTNSDLALWTLQPAVNFDSVPSGGYVWFVAKGPPTLSGTYQGGPIVYRRLQWSGTNAAWADTNWFTVSTATNYQDYYDLDGTNTTLLPTNGISAPQLGGTVELFDVGSRLMNAVIRNGFLWTCLAVGLSGTNGTYAGDSSGSNVTRSGMQWLKLQISPDNSSLALADHARVFDPAATNSLWYFMPSLMVNCAGDMVAGFSGSSQTNYIGAFYTWRLSSGATLAQPRVMQPGTAGPTPPRWGDYSATTLDPTDDWNFWSVQEYAGRFSGFSRWGTVVSQIRPNP